MKKLKIGFIGNFEVPYSTENDRAWSFEKLGHQLIKFQENKTTHGEIFNYANDLDVLFYSHTHGWNIEYLKELFEMYKKKNIPTVSVHLDRWAWLEREKDMGNEATWFTEYIFMADGSPEAVKLYDDLGLNWYWLRPGVIERDCYLAEPDKSKYPYDIIFVGSKGYHHEYPFRPQLVDWLRSTYGNRFGHFGGDGREGKTTREHELNVLYASAKIVVGDSCFGGRPYYWSDRVTETIGRGGFLLHPECEGIGFDHPTYEKLNLESLKNSIDYWLSNDELREKTRLECHKIVKKDHTYTNRAEEMLNIIFDENN